MKQKFYDLWLQKSTVRVCKKCRILNFAWPVMYLKLIFRQISKKGSKKFSYGENAGSQNILFSSCLSQLLITAINIQ